MLLLLLNSNRNIMLLFSGNDRERVQQASFRFGRLFSSIQMNASSYKCRMKDYKNNLHRVYPTVDYLEWLTGRNWFKFTFLHLYNYRILRTGSEIECAAFDEILRWFASRSAVVWLCMLCLLMLDIYPSVHRRLSSSSLRFHSFSVCLGYCCWILTLNCCWYFFFFFSALQKKSFYYTSWEFLRLTQFHEEKFEIWYLAWSGTWYTLKMFSHQKIDSQAHISSIRLTHKWSYLMLCPLFWALLRRFLWIKFESPKKKIPTINSVIRMEFYSLVDSSSLYVVFNNSSESLRRTLRNYWGTSFSDN